MRCPRLRTKRLGFLLYYVVTGLAWVMHSSPTLAQTTWPTRPITIVVPAPAGSASDIVARTITPSLARKLGQPVIIDNRTGAEGTIAGRAVARSEPNGYIIGLGTPSSYAIAPSLRTNLGYNPLKDFAPVSLLGNTPYLLVVNAGLGVNSVAELTALARSKPGVLNYSSAGEGSIAHLGMLMLAKKLGITLTHVPYKSTAQSIIDVANGTIHIQLATIAPTISLYQAGRVRILGVADTQRVALLPEIPTLQEQGLSDFKVTFWLALVVATATPKSIVLRLNRAIHDALAEQDSQKAFFQQGVTAKGSSPLELRQLLESDIALYQQLIFGIGDSAALADGYLRVRGCPSPLTIGPPAMGRLAF